MFMCVVGMAAILSNSIVIPVFLYIYIYINIVILFALHPYFAVGIMTDA
jgi:hypothetical protein